MKIIGIASLFLILYSLLFLSCKKEHEDATGSSNYDYQPSNVGHWVIYDVDSIIHADNDGNTDDSVRYFHFQVKEVISSTFIDGEGRPAQRIERYHYNYDLGEWYITNIWTNTVTSSRMERVEENVRYMPLAFPISSSITWNSNAFNMLEEKEYYYDSFHESLDLNNLSFDSTLTVRKVDFENDDNFVERIYSEEKYAVHVGRIYKVYQDLLKNSGQEIVSGLDYTETVADYGN